jgi:hypothetical protein
MNNINIAVSNRITMSESNNITVSNNASGQITNFFSGIVNSLGSVKGMKGVFTIVLTATILTIFELVFFYNIIVPTVEDEMDTNIKRVGAQIAANLNETTKAYQMQSPISDVLATRAMRYTFNETNAGILDTTAAREKILIDEINRYTIYTGVIIMLVLAIVLYIIWRKIVSTVEKGENEGENANMLDATLSAVITVGVLIGFQILFYFYGKKYRYPGTAGNEELMWVIIDSIEPANETEKKTSN